MIISMEPRDAIESFVRWVSNTAGGMTARGGGGGGGHEEGRGDGRPQRDVPRPRRLDQDHDEVEHLAAQVEVRRLPPDLQARHEA